MPSDEGDRLCLARYAMGTRFEVVLHGRGKPASRDEASAKSGLRAAGEAALDEIEHFDQALDLFRKDSFLSYLNDQAFSKPVRVDLDLFELLKLCGQVHEQSLGAFDVTVGPLMKAWGFHGEGSACQLSEADQQKLIDQVGFRHVALDEENRTVRFLQPGMRLDFGAVAKGFALDRAAAILEDTGVQSALLHGGTSTVLALGAPPGETGWKVAIKAPGSEAGLLKVVTLDRRALSVSAPHGRVIEKEGAALGHVMDPRSGAPAASAALSAVVCRSAALADAWSTALLAAGQDRFESLLEMEISITALLCHEGAAGLTIKTAGPDPDLFHDPGP